jgi:hypothetical protein
MALREAKPLGPREAGSAARGPRGRLRAHGLGRAGGIAARCPGVRSPGTRASQDAPPPLQPLLLVLLLLAALLEHGRADPGKHLVALRHLRVPEERGYPSRPAPDRVAVDGEVSAAPARGFSVPFTGATADELSGLCLRGRHG